jgi:hypothetical protein
MARGKTLWEMLKEKFSGPPVEHRFYNPLQARIGNAVTINTPELSDHNFFLREIREYKRTIGGRRFVFADYVLLARPLGGEDVWAKLRLMPTDDAARTGGPSHHVLLLRLDQELGYNEELHNVVKDTTGKFQILQDGEVAEEFFRINDVAEPYRAYVAVLADLDQDGTMEAGEVKRQEIEYWDYWREVSDAAGQPTTQYLFVEMDKQSGWFQLWKGEDMDPQRVLVI